MAAASACDPRRGAAEAVYECAANLACVGAEPLGLTNCLNFGNPEKPHVAWQLVEAVEGLAEACEQLGVPVVGGNVSLYNEAPSGPIFPTPVVGMVGKLPHAAGAGRLGFAQEGDMIALIGPFEPSAVGRSCRNCAAFPQLASCRCRRREDPGRHGAVRARPFGGLPQRSRHRRGRRRGRPGRVLHRRRSRRVGAVAEGSIRSRRHRGGGSSSPVRARRWRASS